MPPNASVSIPNANSASDTALVPMHSIRCSSQLNSLGLYLTSIAQCDVKSIPKQTPDHGYVCGCADEKLSIGTPENHSLPTSPILAGTISHGSDAVDRLSRSRKHSQASISEDGAEGLAFPSRPNDESVVTTTLPWHGRTLASLTIYGEISVARVPEEFALLQMRLQEEWTFDGGFLVGLSAINAAMFAINPDSIFKVDSYACTAVAISSAACGLGIACNIWFLLRYSWVDLGTFIYRSRDIYGSFVFFSMSSRMPTFCTLISSMSLMSFLGLVAYDARPIGVLVIGVLVTLVMILQFIVYGTHRCATSALRVWRAAEVAEVRASEV